MEDVRFSIVVPTRERAETLVHALRTCLHQDFDDYEIVVSDNCSSPPTQEVVDRLGSTRIRYFRTPKPLAMSDNWEFALQQAKGEYVIFIGDDDGMSLGALRQIDRMLKAFDAKILRWPAASYFWPNVLIDGANQLLVPLGRRLEMLSAREVIHDVVNGRRSFANLPGLYHGIVHRDLISAVQRRGRIFGGSSPDIYSGYAIAYLVDRYPCVEFPLSIGGLSGRSNGVSNLMLKTPTEVAVEFRQLNTQAGLGAHPKVPTVSCLPACLADMFFQVQESLFPDAPSIPVDRKALASKCLGFVRRGDAAHLERGVAAIRQSLADDRELERWFDRLVKELPPEEGETPSVAWGAHGSTLLLDAGRFGVTDVYGAAELCENILRQRDLSEIPSPPARLSIYARMRAVARILLKGR